MASRNQTILGTSMQHHSSKNCFLWTEYVKWPNARIILQKIRENGEQYPKK